VLIVRFRSWLSVFVGVLGGTILREDASRLKQPVSVR
jgi:hypothetical protein